MTVCSGRLLPTDWHWETAVTCKHASPVLVLHEGKTRVTFVNAAFAYHVLLDELILQRLCFLGAGIHPRDDEKPIALNSKVGSR